MFFMTRHMNIAVLLTALAMLKESLLRCCYCRVEGEVISYLCGIRSWWTMKIFFSLFFFLESGHLQSNWYRKQQESERLSGLGNLQAHLGDWNWLTNTSVWSSLNVIDVWGLLAGLFLRTKNWKKSAVYSVSVGCAWKLQNWKRQR